MPRSNNRRRVLRRPVLQAISQPKIPFIVCGNSGRAVPASNDGQALAFAALLAVTEAEIDRDGTKWMTN
jgi:hypothetical protein